MNISLKAVRCRLGHISYDATKQSIVGHVVLISERPFMQSNTEIELLAQVVSLPDI